MSEQNLDRGSRGRKLGPGAWPILLAAMPGIRWWHCCYGIRSRPRTSTRTMRTRACLRGAYSCIRASGLLPGIRAVRNRRKCWRTSPFWSCRSTCRSRAGDASPRWRALCPRTAFLSIRQKESELLPSWFRWRRMVREELPGFVDRYAVLSGPSFALEVATCKPTAVVLGCRDERLWGTAEGSVTATPWFRSSSSARTCRAWSSAARSRTSSPSLRASATAPGFGLNARAALVTRGLAGNQPPRCGAWGAGVDLHGAFRARGPRASPVRAICPVTVRSEAAPRGRVRAWKTSPHPCAWWPRGSTTTQAVHRLAQRLGVDMPVTGTMYSVLYEGFAPREAVQALMGRRLKEE